MSELVRRDPKKNLALPDLGWASDPQRPSHPPGVIALRNLIKSLLRRKTRLICIFILLSIPVDLVIFRLPKLYTAEALLVLRVHDRGQVEIRPDLNGNDPSSDASMNLIRSEIQVLTSRDLAQRVVVDMKLDQQEPHNADAGSVNVVTQYVRNYTGIDLGEVRRTISQAEDFVKGVMGLDLSKAGSVEDRALEQAVNSYRSHFSAFNDGKSFVINISYGASDPERAKEILQRHLQYYIESQISEKEAALKSVELFLDTELSKMAANIQQGEQQLQQFRASHNLLRSGGETVVSHQLSDLVARLGAASADLAARQARLQDIKNAGNGDSGVLASLTIQHAREQEALLAAKLAEIKAKFGAEYPTVQTTAAALAATRAGIANEVARIASGAQNDVNVARANVQSLQAQMSLLTQAGSASEMNDLSIAQLQRETDATRVLYGEMLRRSKQIEIERQVRQEADVRVASEPSASLNPTSPKRMLLLLGSSGAVAIISAGLTLLLDSRRLRSRSLLEIEDNCGIAGLASLPHVRMPRQRRGTFSYHIDPNSVIDPQSVFSLSLQTLCNSLAFYAGGSQPRTVTVTSALPGEGKTFIALYYAQALASSGLRVLIIDGDLRQSCLAERLKMRFEAGLEAVLTGSAPLAEAVCTVPGLSVDALFSSRLLVNPQRVLSSSAISKLLDEATRLYDVIVIDTPPIAAVDDALPIAKVCEATLLVMRWGCTPYDVVRASVRRLHIGGAKVTGAVLNDVNMAEYQSSSLDLEAYRPLYSNYIKY